MVTGRTLIGVHDMSRSLRRFLPTSDACWLGVARHRPFGEGNSNCHQSLGTSEVFLGEFLKGDWDRAVLATKYTNTTPGIDPNAGGNQRNQITRLDTASHVELGFPHDLYSRDLVNGLVYGGMRDTIDA
jgi:hypothetical protein